MGRTAPYTNLAIVDYPSRDHRDITDLPGVTTAVVVLSIASAMLASTMYETPSELLNRRAKAEPGDTGGTLFTGVATPLKMEPSDIMFFNASQLGHGVAVAHQRPGEYDDSRIRVAFVFYVKASILPSQHSWIVPALSSNTEPWRLARTFAVMIGSALGLTQSGRVQDAIPLLVHDNKAERLLECAPPAISLLAGSGGTRKLDKDTMSQRRWVQHRLLELASIPLGTGAHEAEVLVDILWDLGLATWPRSKGLTSKENMPVAHDKFKLAVARELGRTVTTWDMERRRAWESGIKMAFNVL
jgi:hypothetical protein